MYCPKCGAQINEGSAFCQNCGSAVAVAEAPQTTTAAPVAGQPAAEAKTNGLAVAALVTGIVSFFINPLSILAIIFGAIALGQINKTPGVKGKGMAVAGLVLGIVFLALWVIILALVGASFFWMSGF